MNFMLWAPRGPKIRLLLLLAALIASSLSPGTLGRAGARPAGSPPVGPSATSVLTWQLERDVPAPPAGLAASGTADSAKAQLESVLASKLPGSGTQLVTRREPLALRVRQTRPGDGHLAPKRLS